MRLPGKVAIVTGGGTGIGRATARLFAREGARVLVTGRRLPPLEETVHLAESEAGIVRCLQCDVSRPDDVQAMVRTTLEAYGAIDILFNNAAVFTGVGKTILDLTEDEWDSLMAVNLKGVFLCCKYVVPAMIANGGGVIINCGSVSGHAGQRRQGAYNVAKGGVELLTRCMALDFAPHHIRVNEVCPGLVEKDTNRENIRRREPEILTAYPLGRVGQPDDVANAVLYLASDEASWVTGTSLFVDGGYMIQ